MHLAAISFQFYFDAQFYIWVISNEVNNSFLIFTWSNYLLGNIQVENFRQLLDLLDFLSSLLQLILWLLELVSA